MSLIMTTMAHMPGYKALLRTFTTQIEPPLVAAHIEYLEGEEVEIAQQGAIIAAATVLTAVVGEVEAEALASHANAH